MLENLENLRNDLAQKAKEDAELNANNFNTEGATELTEEEQESIEKLKEELGDNPVVMVKEKLSDDEAADAPASQTAEEFTKSLDDRVAMINEGKESLKLVNAGDIQKTVADIKAESRSKAIQMFRNMGVKKADDTEISDDDYLAINDSALAALKEFMGTDTLDADKTIKRLSKLPAKQVFSIFPEQFLQVYLTENELKFPNIKAKDRLITVIAYLITTGPELDYLNDYIDDENKLMIVSKRLMQCQLDLGEALKDDAKLSEMVASSKTFSPDDDSFWALHIKDPKRVHNEFAQRIVIYQNYLNGYGKILEDYPDDGTHEQERKLILNEIEECTCKMNCYQSICDLKLMRELYEILFTRFKTNKKVNMKYLTQECIESVDRVRRSKQNVPFPGYKGNQKKPEIIFSAYIAAFSKMVVNYNAEIEKILESSENPEKEDTRGVIKIQLDGYDEGDVTVVYSMVLLLLMGRIMKALSKNNRTKYDAIELDAYFQVFCKAGTDVYLMTDMWNICKEFVQYILDKWYLPEKVAETKKLQNKKR
jgi:hypothetical protein